MTSTRPEMRAVTARELKFKVLAGDLRRGILAGEWLPGSKLPTEKELVAQTGLSLTTVRRALDELTEQGLVVRRQGAGTFVPERSASEPRTKRTIGVLVPDTSLYYPKVLAGIEAAASAASARMLLSCYHYEQQEEDRDIRSLLEGGADGLLLVPTLTGIERPHVRARQLFELPVPVVLIERRLPDAGPEDRSEYVRTNHAGGAYDAVAHLASLGHERIGLVCRRPNPTAVFITEGFRQAVADLGLPSIVEDYAPITEWSPDRTDLALSRLLEDRATAAVVFGDREAAWLEGSARRAGVRVPDDLALVAYDDESADVAEVPLTAVSPPKYALGRLAVETLMRRLAEGESSPRHQINLRPRIVVRDSCGAPRRADRKEAS